MLTATCCSQDPELLKLFFPYLPKNQRSLPSLRKALAIPGFQEQLLRGEAQASCSCSVPQLLVCVLYPFFVGSLLYGSLLEHRSLHLCCSLQAGLCLLKVR